MQYEDSVASSDPLACQLGGSPRGTFLELFKSQAPITATMNIDQRGGVRAFNRPLVKNERDVHAPSSRLNSA